MKEGIKEFKKKYKDYLEVAYYRGAMPERNLGDEMLSDIRKILRTENKKTTQAILKKIDEMKKEHKVFECSGTNKYEDWCTDINCPNAKEEKGYNQALEDITQSLKFSLLKEIK